MNFIPGIFLNSGLWILFLFVAAFLFVGLIILTQLNTKERDFSVYVKRKYLFDSASELELFKKLVEIYKDQYYVFPQVHYSHLVEVRKSLTHRERIAYWNSINRKSADFVLCDLEQVLPQLVIELDGSSHNLDSRKERDEFINKMLHQTGLPILHLKTTNLDRDFIQGEIMRTLAAGIKI